MYRIAKKTASSFAAACFWGHSSALSHLCVLVSLTCLPACEDNKEQSKTKAAWQVSNSPEMKPNGPHFEDEDFSFTVKAAKACMPQSPIVPASNERRISVPVKVKSKGAREIPVSAMSFTLSSEEGHEFRPTLAGCVPPLERQRLSNKASLEGEVAFDIPQELQKLELTFHPFLLGRKEVRARVLVPQEP